jgi:hypothetical protein
MAGEQKFIAEDWPESKKFQKKVSPKITRRKWPKTDKFFKVYTTWCDMQQNGRMIFHEHDWSA